MFETVVPRAEVGEFERDAAGGVFGGIEGGGLLFGGVCLSWGEGWWWWEERLKSIRVKVLAFGSLVCGRLHCSYFSFRALSSLSSFATRFTRSS